MGTFQPNLVRHVAANGLAALNLEYTCLSDGTFYYRGARPSPEWHAHGHFCVSPHDLKQGRLVKIVVRKQRWRLRGSNQTCHSRPPDDLGRRYTAIVVATCLFAWLDASMGIHRHVGIVPALDLRPDRRTTQRWLAVARHLALQVEQAIRHAVIDRLEPRSVEELFPGGIPPPPRGHLQRWRDPARTNQIHRALTMLFGASIALDETSSSLLAEARRRLATRLHRNG